MNVLVAFIVQAAVLTLEWELEKQNSK